MTPAPLPIDPSCRNWSPPCAARRASCCAPTGAGKTTRVPPALLDAGLAEGRRILMLEPRRLAARAAARRMAEERGGRSATRSAITSASIASAGRARASSSSRPAFCCALLQDDPFLESIGVVLFDEFHERGLESDLALGMVRLMQQTVRPELRIVVMSATLAVEERRRLSRRLPGRLPARAGCSRSRSSTNRGRNDSPGRPPRPRRRSDCWSGRAGDVLVFLPGLQEIRQTARHLEAAGRSSATWPCCRCTATCRPSSRTRPCCRKRAARSCWRPTWRKRR